MKKKAKKTKTQFKGPDKRSLVMILQGEGFHRVDMSWDRRVLCAMWKKLEDVDPGQPDPAVISYCKKDEAKDISYSDPHVALTKLTDKHHSGLVIRKITKFGFPIYVAIIADDNLDSMDHVILGVMADHKKQWQSDSIQDKRNVAGEIIEAMTQAYPSTEGVAVILYIDKTCISSLFGDFMNHAMCRQELYFLLNMGCHV